MEDQIDAHSKKGNRSEAKILAALVDAGYLVSTYLSGRAISTISSLTIRLDCSECNVKQVGLEKEFCSLIAIASRVMAEQGRAIMV